MAFFLYSLAVLLPLGGTFAQDSLGESKALPEIAITAAKSDRVISDLPVPVSVISGKEIKAKGVVRLDQVLAEQPGLAIVSDVTGRGKGIQIQGFDPAYTMIMIDGEPLIGRTAGTLDLSRITLGDIERIEIIKGPSSCLYGSEALGGAINIITKKTLEGLASTVSGRYGSYNTADVNADISYKKNKFEIYQFINRYSGAGYASNGNTQNGYTIPPFISYTYQGKLALKLTKKLQLGTNWKGFTDARMDHYRYQSEMLYSDAFIKETTFLPSLTYQFSKKHKLSLKSNWSRYGTEQRVKYVDDSLFDKNYFTQYLMRSEAQFDWKLNAYWKLISGAGLLNESVEATRYISLKRFESVYYYLQADGDVGTRTQVVLGARYDLHSVYGSQLSPKLALSYKLYPGWKLKASIGRGFKAPDFRQLYLAFTNATEGYSVFGAEELNNQLLMLQAQGQLTDVYVDPTKKYTLATESSWAYNLGLSATPLNRLSIDLNIFRNDLNNLIETFIAARKTSGQQVFSYRNLSRVRTQGFEVSGKYVLGKLGFVSAGYQFLLTEDLNQVEKIKRGEVYNETRLVNLNDYRGLMNRSKHMANVAFSFNQEKRGWEETIRLNYRGAYGFTDLNGNNIIDSDKEMVKGYYTVNLSVSKDLFKEHLRIQGTVDNVFNYTDKVYIPTMQGRLWSICLSYRFHSTPKNL